MNTNRGFIGSRIGLPTALAIGAALLGISRVPAPAGWVREPVRAGGTAPCPHRPILDAAVPPRVVPGVAARTVLDGAAQDARPGAMDDDDAVTPCVADFDDDGRVTPRDVLAYRGAFDAQDRRADCTRDGVLNTLDWCAFHRAYAAGCP